MHHNDALRDKLVKYIEDMYALENHIVEQLDQQVKQTTKFPEVQARIQQHLDQTQQHRARMEERLSAYNKKPSAMKGALSNMMGNVMGAVGGTRPDSLAMTARDDYAVEHMEIGSYLLLIATAQAYGDTATVQACEANLRDEVAMANWLESQIGMVALLDLQNDGINISQQEMQDGRTAAMTALQSAQTGIGQIGAGQMGTYQRPTTPTI